MLSRSCEHFPVVDAMRVPDVQDGVLYVEAGKRGSGDWENGNQEKGK